MSIERAPAHRARQALYRLAREGLAPTPENFRASWEAVAHEPGAWPAREEADEACDELAQLFRAAAACLAEGADAAVAGALDRLQSQVAPPYEAARLRSLHGPLAEALEAERARRAILAQAAQGIRDILAGLLERLGLLADSTSQFAERVAAYSREIERADGLPSLARLASELGRETRAEHERLARSARDLGEARSRIEAQAARIAEVENALAQAREQVRTDELTGALNRRGHDLAWARECARADRTGEALSLVLLDLDAFKALNDRAGHAAGDRALVHLVERARKVLRAPDLVSRWGGDEFALVMPGTGATVAAQVTERLRRALTRAEFLEGRERLFITFSAGIAARLRGEAPEATERRADAALYEAKRAGRNRVIIAPGA